MKKNSLFISILLICVVSFGFSGCSRTGMMTAKHNGKKYWNPGNCDGYRYNSSNPDTIYCTTKGEPNGIVLNPVSQQQLDNYYREKEIEAKSASSSGGGNNGMVSCYKFGDLSIYKHVYQFKSSICPIGYYAAY